MKCPKCGYEIPEPNDDEEEDKSIKTIPITLHVNAAYPFPMNKNG